MVMEIVNDTAVVLEWTAPANTFGDLTAYVVTCGPQIPELQVITVNVPNNSTLATVSSLENGAVYNCSVRAQNEAGLLSESSSSVLFTAREIGQYSEY